MATKFKLLLFNAVEQNLCKQCIDNNEKGNSSCAPF